jgi:hypothetical protein
MGTFAETVIEDYRSSFADQGKQTSVFHFRMQQTNRSLLYLFSVCSKPTEVATFHKFHFPFAEFRMSSMRQRIMEKWRHGDM